jgi:uncharacterized protein YecE (DUF72 family)
MKAGILRAGTSGIVVPGAREQRPENFQSASRLTYYNSFFNTLEVNSTFRKIPRASTLERWSNEVSRDFTFTFKISRDITHVKQLEPAVGLLDKLIPELNNIGEKKGCLLIQFPGSVTDEYTKPVSKLLHRLHKLDKNNEWRKAVEFRSVSWYNDNTVKLLTRYNASLVLHDMPKSSSLAFDVPFSFGYFRYHGPTAKYRGSYEPDFLQNEASKIRTLLDSGKDVYAYFNNTMGDAFQNAVTLKRMVG